MNNNSIRRQYADLIIFIKNLIQAMSFPTGVLEESQQINHWQYIAMEAQRILQILDLDATFDDHNLEELVLMAKKIEQFLEWCKDAANEDQAQKLIQLRDLLYDKLKEIRNEAKQGPIKQKIQLQIELAYSTCSEIINKKILQHVRRKREKANQQQKIKVAPKSYQIHLNDEKKQQVFKANNTKMEEKRKVKDYKSQLEKRLQKN